MPRTTALKRRSDGLKQNPKITAQSSLQSTPKLPQSHSTDLVRRMPSKLMYREVERAIRAASADLGVTVIMLIGAGDYYSSGNDLSNFSEIKHPLTIAKEAREVLFSFVDSFITCQKPIIVAVNGPAIG
jgi:1,4-dihydroxy-2-naphthoyl-CoA synthase